SEKYLGEHEDLAASMVAASTKGWQHYLEHPEETNSYIGRINPEMSLEALAFGVKALAPLAIDEVAHEQGVGTMSLERWQTLVGQLEELGLIKPGQVETSKTFTTRFLVAVGSRIGDGE
ncbi:MAG TPA: hypothetical protein VGX78_13010, partial [Pirellulales bacterium]|nr:hypothetical protein [Pirellulales bacterium]